MLAAFLFAVLPVVSATTVFFAGSANNTVTVEAPYLQGVQTVTIDGQPCAAFLPQFGVAVQPCLPALSRDALCAIEAQQNTIFAPTACTAATQPCYNYTTSSSPKSCAAVASPDAWCRMSACMDSSAECIILPYNNTFFTWPYTAGGLVGVECAPGMVCDAHLRCVTTAPPQCPGTLQCIVSGVSAGIHGAVLTYANGSSAVVPGVVTSLAVPVLESVVAGIYTMDPRMVELSATTPFELIWADAFTSTAANVTLYCESANQLVQTTALGVFDAQDALTREGLAFADVTCVAVAAYGALNFTAQIPGVELWVILTAVPSVFSTCPAGIYAGIPTTVTVNGAYYAPESNLTCFVNGVPQRALFIDRGAVQCELYWPNETLSAPSYLALTVSNDGITPSPQTARVAIIGSCGNLKPNSVPIGNQCQCPPGFFDQTAYCQPCAAGTYQPNAGQQACIPCGADQTTLAATHLTAAAACTCKPGFYAASASPLTCAACPPGFTCNGTATTVNPGFWRARAADMFAIPCASTAQCPGGGGAGARLCAPAYKGPLCQVCRKGYGALGGECVPCPPGGLSGFMLAVVVGGALVVVVALVRATATFEFGNHGMGVTFKVAFAYFQILFYVGKLAARWSSQSSIFFAALVPVTLTPSFVAVQCAARASFYTGIGVVMAFPAIAWVAIALFYWAWGLWLRRDRDGVSAFPWTDVNDDRIKSTFVVWYLMHPVIAEAVVRSFRCVAVPGTGTSFLVDNPEVDCASASYRRYVPLAACYTVFYVVGFIAYLLANIYRYAAVVIDGNHAEAIGVGKWFVFFARGYTNDAYLWEFMIVFRKLGVVAADALLPPEIQLVWAGLIVGLSLAATVQWTPYRSLLVNYLDVAALLALLFTVVLGLHQRLLAAPDERAVFVLLVLVNTAVGFVLVAAMFKSAEHILQRPVMLLSRLIAEYHQNHREIEMGDGHIAPDIKMYSRRPAPAAQE